MRMGTAICFMGNTVLASPITLRDIRRGIRMITDCLKDLCRQWLRPLGYDVVRWHPVPADALARRRLLTSVGIDVVIDVGANVGQFAKGLRNPIGYTGQIISFEPLPDAFAELQAAADSDPDWEVHRLAIGDQVGHLPINVSRNRVSSSFLPITAASTAVEPASAFENRCTVSMRRLDDVIPTLNAVTPASRIMLKIDTQGFESRVLDGAQESLKRMNLVQMEMSLVQLYETETLFLEMCNRMYSRGFTLVALDPGFGDAATGKLLQVDGVFARVGA